MRTDCPSSPHRPQLTPRPQCRCPGHSLRREVPDGRRSGPTRLELPIDRVTERTRFHSGELRHSVRKDSTPDQSSLLPFSIGHGLSSVLRSRSGKGTSPHRVNPKSNGGRDLSGKTFPSSGAEFVAKRGEGRDNVKKRIRRRRNREVDLAPSLPMPHNTISDTNRVSRRESGAGVGVSRGGPGQWGLANLVRAGTQQP